MTTAAERITTYLDANEERPSPREAIDAVRKAHPPNRHGVVAIDQTVLAAADLRAVLADNERLTRELAETRAKLAVARATTENWYRSCGNNRTDEALIVLRHVTACILSDLADPLAAADGDGRSGQGEARKGTGDDPGAETGKETDGGKDHAEGTVTGFIPKPTLIGLDPRHDQCPGKLPGGETCSCECHQKGEAK